MKKFEVSPSCFLPYYTGKACHNFIILFFIKIYIKIYIKFDGNTVIFWEELIKNLCSAAKIMFKTAWQLSVNKKVVLIIYVWIF